MFRHHRNFAPDPAEMTVYLFFNELFLFLYVVVCFYKVVAHFYMCFLNMSF